MIPERLKKGDLLRVLSPSSSLARVGGMAENLIAKKRLEALGFQVSFSKNILEDDLFQSASIKSRVEDFHEAFLDEKVKGILATIGGFSSNELLPYLDFELIKAHPKIICGYSDTTAILNAIYAKTGLVTYYGPSYSSFKMTELQDYQSSAFEKAVTKDNFILEPSAFYSSDEWFLPTKKRNLIPNTWKIYQAGTAEGRGICGNLNTYGLLQGTPYQVQVKRPVLFVESAEGDSYLDFARDLASILQVYPDAAALLIGRFPKEVAMTEERLLFILDKHPRLKTIPVMYDLNFGHTQPIFTFPIGSLITVDTSFFALKVQHQTY